MRKLILLFFILINCISSMAQVNITQPFERMIFQRNNSNQAPVLIAGSYQVDIDSIVARAIPRASGQGTLVDWTKICNQPQNGYFTGSLTLNGGWYILQLRAYKNGSIVGSDQIERVGVGEVFAIAGQSNAQGGAITGYAAMDDRVNSVGFDNDTTLYNKLPLGFSQLGGQTNSIGPFHYVPWAWGILGDSLASELNVPILFYGAAHGGTSSKNWSDATQGIIDPSVPTWLRMYLGAPYKALEYSVAYYASLTGLRGVLWQQGESDHFNSTQGYYDNLVNVINKTREQSEHPNLAWMVARSAYSQGYANHIVIAQINLSLNFPNVFQGPDLDQFAGYQYRTDDIHFDTPLGQIGFANEWYKTLTLIPFFLNSSPLMASPFILPTLVCNPNNVSNAITLNLPISYPNYAWSNRQNTNLEARGTTNTCCTYFATYPPLGYEKFNWQFDSTATITVPQGRYALNVKKASKKTLFSPIIELNPFTLPTMPSFTSSASQIRPGESITFTASNCNGSYVWSNGQLGSPYTFSPAATASYTVQCKTLHCYSNNSNTETVLVSSCFPNALNLNTSVTVEESPYKSKLNILSTQNIGSSAKINYSAKNNILLEPGFVANNGSVFTATVEDCN